MTGEKRLHRKQKREEREFYFFISPWLMGFLFLTLAPMLACIILSFARWNIITPPEWVGFDNYKELMHDPLFWKSLGVTSTFVLSSVVLKLAASLLVAMFLNQKVRAIGLFRTIFYLPTILPIVASSMLWKWIFFPNGLLNFFVTKLGLSPQNWLANEKLALPSLILMSFWGFGASMIIFLAGLQSIPQYLYEAAQIDGAGWWSKFWNVTFPMLSPVIFFNLVMGFIGSFKVFAPGYLITDGGPHYATLFYVLYLFRNAFEYFNLGYASALGWILFFIIMAFTLLIIKSSPFWVYYEAERR